MVHASMRPSVHLSVSLLVSPSIHPFVYQWHCILRIEKCKNAHLCPRPAPSVRNGSLFLFHFLKRRIFVNNKITLSEKKIPF